MRRPAIILTLLSFTLGIVLFKTNTYIKNTVTESFQSLCIFQNSDLAMNLFGKSAPNSSCFINKSLLERKIKTGLPKWAIQQIKEDLSSFEKITESDLDKIFEDYNTPYNTLVRFKVKDRKIIIITNSPKTNPPGFKALIKQIENRIIEGRSNRNKYYATLTHNEDPRIKAFEYVLKYLVKQKLLANTDFILTLNDYAIVDSKNPLPIFTFAKDLDTPIEKDLILIPDWQNLCSTPDFRKRIRTANQSHPWESKLNIVFWRGGPNDYSGFRNKLVNFSLKYPGKIDAKFTGIPTNGQETKFVLPEEHLKYKYLISIDGTRASWERLIWHLHSNSLVFKHQSNHMQWFYKGILPNVHFIPVTDELSILEKVKWAETHLQEAQTIIQAARNFVDQNLEIEDLYHYILELLQEYNKKLAKSS